VAQAAGPDLNRVWAFDVDGTIIDSLSGTSLRPGVQQLLVDLRATGCRILLWSAGGAAYARQRAEQHGIADLIDGCFDKDGRDAAGRYVAGFVAAGDEVTFVDDRPEDLPVDASVEVVSPYITGDRFDGAVARLRDRVGLQDTRR
jgi:long-chain acyl-CoA synthetase